MIARSAGALQPAPMRPISTIAWLAVLSLGGLAFFGPGFRRTPTSNRFETS
jgi:hypothetical protein